MLPLTQQRPKELLLVGDKPLIHYSVLEGVKAGIRDVIIVTSPEKKSLLENYFRSYEVRDCFECYENLNFYFSVQPHPRGLGDAIYCAREHLISPYFAVILPDEYIPGLEENVLSGMVRLHGASGKQIIALQFGSGRDVINYGVASTRKTENGSLLIEKIIEKPKLEEAPSDQIVIGRYILSAGIIDRLADLQSVKLEDELDLTLPICIAMYEEEFWAYNFSGKSFDCGGLQGYLSANSDYYTRKFFSHSLLELIQCKLDGESM